MSIAEFSNRMTVRQAAEYIGVERQFLDRRRNDGTGPEYLKLGRLVFYERTLLDEWISAQRRRSTSVEASG